MKPLRLVVLGTHKSNPYAGIAWMHVQTSIGLLRLGHDAYYFETTSTWPYDRIRDCKVCAEGQWMPRGVAKAVVAYACALWRDRRPGDCESRLEAARTYLNFWAFDDDSLQSSKPQEIRRLQQLRAAAERLEFA